MYLDNISGHHVTTKKITLSSARIHIITSPFMLDKPYRDMGNMWRKCEQNAGLFWESCGWCSWRKPMKQFGVTWLQVSRDTTTHSNLFTSLLYLMYIKKTILSYSKINCSVGILFFVPRLCWVVVPRCTSGNRKSLGKYGDLQWTECNGYFWCGSFVAPRAAVGRLYAINIAWGELSQQRNR